MTTELMKYSAACHAIAVAKQVDEVKDVNYSITAVGKKDGVKTSRKKTELIITPRRKR